MQRVQFDLVSHSLDANPKISDRPRWCALRHLSGRAKFHFGNFPTNIGGLSIEVFVKKVEIVLSIEVVCARLFFSFFGNIFLGSGGGWSVHLTFLGIFSETLSDLFGIFLFSGVSVHLFVYFFLCSFISCLGDPFEIVCLFDLPFLVIFAVTLWSFAVDLVDEKSMRG